MAQRTAVLDYRTSGTSGARSNVVSLAEALERQKRAADNLAPSLRQTTLNGGVMGAMFQSATARIGATTNAIGPLGAGLGAIARLAPAAGLGLVQMAAGAERASLMSRALNTTMLAGTGTMIAGGVAALAYADDVIRAGDAYASLKAKIAIYTGSAVEAAQVERQLYANARTTRSAVEGQVTLYSRLVPAVLDFGKGQEYAMRVTELTTKALAIQGAEAREQWASTIQFSQAIGSGVLRGDEFRTLREAAPQLLRYVAANLEMNGKIGTSFSSLKKLADEGLLSTGKILDALMRAGPQIEADFARAPITAQQGWVILKDKITQTAGGFAMVTGAQRGLFDWLVKLTDQTEAFRQKMLLDPGSFDGLKAATGFIGDIVGSIADVGGLAVENFDAIVTAGQAVIALKLGEVFASWFASAANASRQALTDLRAYQAAARMNAAATLSPVAAAAATGLRDGAAALAVRATEMQARADIAAAQAAAAKAAAYEAANRVNVLKTTNDARSVIVTEAETAAAAQAALATKLEEQAKRAAASATSVAAAASARNAVALEAETIATAGVTTATLAKNAVQRVALGLYGLLGGAIGIATIALGALIFAIWKAEEAHRAEVQAQHDALVVSDRLRGITDQLTASTWAQVPALLEKARAMRESAAAAREDAEAQLRLVKARQQLIAKQAGTPGLAPSSMGEALAFGLMAGGVDREASETQRNLDAAKADEFRAKMESERQRSIALEVEARDLQKRLSSRKDAAGRPISADALAGMERRLSAIEAAGAARVDFFSARMAVQQRAIEAEKDPAKRAALVRGSQLYSENFDAAAGIVTATDRATATTPTATGDGKPKRVTVPGGVSSALTELTRQQYRPKAGLDRFSLAGGMIQDSTAGGTFTARSEDEAAAAAKYVEQIEAINSATDAQIAKTGESREALRHAASARLAYAVSTSQASQAEDRWADLLAESAGESRAAIKAEREVEEMRARGAAITDEAAARYIDFVKVREAAQRAAQAVNFDTPLAKDAADKVMAGTRLPTRADGAVDLDAAVRQLQDRRAAILAETEALILAQTRQQVVAGELSREDAAKRGAERIAAARVAVETELQDRILKLTRQRADDQAQIDEARATKASGAIEGAFHDLVFGGDFGDIGKRLVNDLLEAIYQELIGNPLRKVIKDLVHETLNPESGGGGGSSGGTLSAIWNGARAIFGFDGGGYTGLGGRGKVAGVVHGQEFVVNADATSRWLPVLAAINSGRMKPPAGYRSGGLVGMVQSAWNGDEPYPRPRGGSAGQRAAMEVGRDRAASERQRPVMIGSIDASINAPFAESAQLRQVAAQQRDLQKALPDIVVAVIKKLSGR